jgi:hypothetical protein
MPTRTTAALILAMIGIVLSGYALNLAAAGVTLAEYLNYIGLALQLAGFLTVAVGLADIRAKFTDQPSVRIRVGRRLVVARRVAWVRIRRMLGRPVSPRTVQLSAAGMVTATGKVTAQVLYGTLDLDRPVRDLLAQLDARTRDIQLRVNGVESELGVEATARESGDSTERTARKAADAGLDRKLSDLAAGGLRLEWWGVWMFLAGTVLSTIPDELAGWIS